MKKILGIAFLIGIGAGAPHIPFGSMCNTVGGWFTDTAPGDFQAFFVSDQGTAYSLEEFEAIGGSFDAETGEVGGAPICKKTGSTQFQRQIGRRGTALFGGEQVDQFELATEVQAQVRIEQIAAETGVDYDTLIRMTRKLEAAKSPRSRTTPTEAPVATPNVKTTKVAEDDMAVVQKLLDSGIDIETLKSMANAARVSYTD